ncbi:hypothetical protein [Teichococcus vastitatis]|uniref:hypothetical protein n=1 Tax=Teichococcus vastitatis TaxID=2307076 RepID=UPI0013002DE3|nr:hypothetical protein [Pseudoroseomonas vastitatis]
MAERVPTPDAGPPRGRRVLSLTDLQPRGADAALITLCRRIVDAEAACHRLYEAECRAEEQADQPGSRQAGHRRQRLMALQAALGRRFAATPPTAVPGLRAKVRVYLTRCQHADGTVMPDGWDLHALCREVLQLTEGDAWSGSAHPAPG